MSVPKKSKVQAESPDEIEQIMSEIEELQQEMTAPAPPSPFKASGPKLKMVSATVVDPEPSMTSGGGEVEEDILGEIQAGAGGGSDGGLEDTLGEMKGDEGNGNGLLDQAIQADVEPKGHFVEPKAHFDEPKAHYDEVTEMDAEETEEEAATDTDTDSNEENMANNNDNDGNPGTLSIQLKGNMTLKLNYEFEGQDVTIGFSEGALRVQLADGTEFKVPMGKKKVPLKRVG